MYYVNIFALQDLEESSVNSEVSHTISGQQSGVQLQQHELHSFNTLYLFRSLMMCTNLNRLFFTFGLKGLHYINNGFLSQPKTSLLLTVNGIPRKPRDQLHVRPGARVTMVTRPARSHLECYLPEMKEHLSWVMFQLCGGVLHNQKHQKLKHLGQVTSLRAYSLQSIVHSYLHLRKLTTIFHQVRLHGHIHITARLMYIVVYSDLTVICLHGGQCSSGFTVDILVNS